MQESFVIFFPTVLYITLSIHTQLLKKKKKRSVKKICEYRAKNIL